MRVLVTGGAGFIGSHVVEHLCHAGAEVRVLDIRDRGDIAEPRTVRAGVRGVDAVCHQAARVGLGVDFRDAPAYVRDNDLGTAELLRALFEAGFRGRLVLASSMVVYGEGRYRCGEHGRVAAGPRREADLRAGRFDPPCPGCGGALAPELVTEDDPADPRNVYAATKLHQEHLCAAFGRETGARVVALRYHNVYGPRMPRDTPYAGVAAIFRSALEAGTPVQVFEDGAQRRDFVHVDDVARANVLALEASPSVTGAFNIASGEPRTVLNVAESMARAWGAKAPQPLVTGRYRLGDVRHVVASPERARSVLGFEARVRFEDGVADLSVPGAEPKVR
jgi:dTDP-L-rhamnose 4-epimerase